MIMRYMESEPQHEELFQNIKEALAKSAGKVSILETMATLCVLVGMIAESSPMKIDDDILHNLVERNIAFGKQRVREDEHEIAGHA